MQSSFVRPFWALVLMMLVASTAFAGTNLKTRKTQTSAEVTSAAMASLKQRNIPTTATLDSRYRFITGQVRPQINPAEAALMTTDSLVQLFYTARPILAVGWFESYDPATSTVLVRIDPKLTKFPHTIDVRAKETKIAADRLIARELHKERRFKIEPRTYLVDDRAPLDPKPGEKARPQSRIPLSNFKEGQKISVLYRMEPDSNVAPVAINMSLVDPARTYFSADFDPMRGRVLPRTRNVPTSGSTPLVNGPTRRVRLPRNLTPNQ